MDISKKPKEFSNGLFLLLTHGGLYRNVSRILIYCILFLFLNKWVINKYIDHITFLLLVICIASEFLNTSIELLADKVQPNCDVDIGNIKDLAGSASPIVILSYVVYLIYYQSVNK